MSNRLPSTRTTQALSLPEARIEALHGALEAHPAHPTRYCVRSDRAATTAERRALCAVSERLEAELAPCANLKHIDTVVTRVLLGFEQGRGRGDEENDALIGEYLSALKALPLAAIHAAAERFRSATTLLPWNRRFRPSPAEFAAEAREGMVPMRTRLLHVTRAGRAIEQPHTDAVLQTLDGASHTRLGEPEGLGRSGHGSGLDHGHQNRHAGEQSAIVRHRSMTPSPE
jgi:hypothetical protein